MKRSAFPRGRGNHLSAPQANIYFEERLLDRPAALRRFLDVRAATERLTAPLSAEDAAIQTMPDVSPAKWHLAHTTWVFEAFILKQPAAEMAAGYEEIDPDYHYLFNSYYEAEGPRHPRPQRGLISRPSLAEVLEYRAHVDAAMTKLIESSADDETWVQIAPLVDLACHHEEQHQELILTDIKHVLWTNPLRPAYSQTIPKAVCEAPELSWTAFEEGLREIGHGGNGFAYDNEGPRHKQYIHAFQLASRPATNGEYLAFIEDGGYSRPELWLSDGWFKLQEEGWTRPLYWEQGPDGWQVFTLRGQHGMNEAEPVAHLSYFEADAFARWSKARLPREAELEIALNKQRNLAAANDAGSGALNPVTASGKGLAQLYGDVWEWTQSSYAAYPGYQPAPGAIGEYNGKFMCNQYVLKGGSCFTPPGHIRATYRNFFPTDARWQMTGVRLARDI